MCAVALLNPRHIKGFSCLWIVCRSLSNRTLDSNHTENGVGRIEGFLNESWKNPNFEDNVEEKTSIFCDPLGSSGAKGSPEGHYQKIFSSRQSFSDRMKNDCKRILNILHQDSHCFDAELALSDLGVRVSDLLVREVLLAVLKTINHANKNRWARLGYKFFSWSSKQENYMHTPGMYNMMMKIFAESNELKAMCSLFDEMIEKGCPTTAYTFNILICTCGGAGLARNVIERFIKSKNHNFRPSRHSFDAILHSLLTLKQYKLIEWVYQIMLVEGFTPGLTTYNIVMCAKLRLGKLNQFHGLLDEMCRCGVSPDFHTYNLLLHVFGKGDNPLAAVKLLNHMIEVGLDPSVLHFTTLIDGLSRAGNLDACRYFFNEMTRHGCVPDVVCYTVMITGYVLVGEFNKAQDLYSEMINRGQVPNVFTYNSMIRGLCMMKRFREASLMLKEMEFKGCKPNFHVYNTVVGHLRNAGRLNQAHRVIRRMVKNGQYIHLQEKFSRCRKR